MMARIAGYYRDAAGITYAADGRRSVSRPQVMADGHLWQTAAQLVARADGSTLDGHDDAMSSAVDDIETLAAYAALLTAERGSMNALRAAHTWFGADGHAADAIAYASTLPDWSTSMTSDMTRRRSNSGRTVTTVTRHGRSWSVGHAGIWHGRPIRGAGSLDVDRRAARVAAALDGIRVSSSGAVDGRDLAAVTDILFDVPPLIGGDLTSWSEVLPDAVSARVAAGPYNYAAWVDDTMPASAERKRAARRVSWPTRYALPPRPPRADETSQTVDRLPCERVDGRSWFRVTECPTVLDDGRVMVGHGRPRDRTATVRTRRRSTRVSYAVKVRRSMSLADGLAIIAADAKRGDRVSWRHGLDVGSLTVSAAGHYAARIDGRAWEPRRSRTAAGLADAVRRVTD